MNPNWTTTPASFLIIKTNSHNLFIIIICERVGLTCSRLLLALAAYTTQCSRAFFLFFFSCYSSSSSSSSSGCNMYVCSLRVLLLLTRVVCSRWSKEVFFPGFVSLFLESYFLLIIRLGKMLYYYGAYIGRSSS